MSCRPLLVFLCSGLLTFGWGCGDANIAHVTTYYADKPEKSTVEAAARCLDQKEDWASKAEYAVVKAGNGWEVTAWRVDYPTAKGPQRYKPWGFRVLTLDRDNQVTAYRAAKP